LVALLATASVTTFSANATSSTTQEVLVKLGEMLVEMITTDVETTAEQRAILDELTAEAQRLGLY
jgi:hypothetical protein